MHTADLFLYAAIGLMLVGVVVAAWLGKRKPTPRIPRVAIYAVWIVVLGLLTAYFILRSPS